MTRVIAVAFQEYGQLHHLDAGDLAVRAGDWVLHPTPDGDEVARCVWGPEEVALDEPLPLCSGPASSEQVDRAAARRADRVRIADMVRERIDAHGLAMEVVAVDLVESAGSRLVAVYFRAPRRVDFRTLVPDLARTLGARVDLRQVSGRDPARLIGGVGVCGRELCCTTFLRDPEPVSMRLATMQGQGSNPLAVTGACGHLMCCLRYEAPYYADFTASAEQSAGDGAPRGCPLVSACSTAARRTNR